MSDVIKFRCRACADAYEQDGAKHADQARAADEARAAWEKLADKPGDDEAAAWGRYRAAFDAMDGTARGMVDRGVYTGETLTLELIQWAMAEPGREIALPACITCGGSDYEFFAPVGADAAVGTVAKALRAGKLGPHMEKQHVRPDAPPALPLPAQQEHWEAAKAVERLRKDWADERGRDALANASAVMAQLKAASLVLARQVRGAGDGRKFAVDVVTPPPPEPSAEPDKKEPPADD